MRRIFEKEIDKSKFEEFVLELFKCYLSEGVYFAPADYSSQFAENVRKRLREFFRDVSKDYVAAFKESLLRENYELGPKMWQILLRKKRGKLSETLELYAVGERVGNIEAPKTAVYIYTGEVNIEGSMGMLISGESAREVAELYYEHILLPAFNNDTYERLVRTYKLVSCTLNKRREEMSRIYESVLSEIEELEDYSYGGKSFPSFPGILRESSVKLSLLPERGEFEKYYSVPIYGEGWDEKRNVLLKLLENKKNEKVRMFLKELNLEWLELNDYKKLFEMREQVIREVNTLLKDVLKNGKIGDSAVKGIAVKKKKRGKRRKVEIIPSKVDRVEETWVILGTVGNEAYDGLKGFISQLFANSYYLPKRVRIFKKSINYKFKHERYTRKRPILEIINQLKATFDSVVLFALLKGEFSLDTPFDEFKQGYNIVFLNNMRKRGISNNTVFHDYYYHLLDGVEAMDTLFSNVHSMRARVNVQNMKWYYYKNPRDYWSLDKIKNVLKKMNLESIILYEFDNGKSGVIVEHKARNGTIRYFGLEEVLWMAGRTVDISKIPGLLAQSESLLMAYSFKNTSTTGYSIRVDGNEVQRDIYAISVIGQSLEGSGMQAKYLRIVRAVKYGLTESRENVRAKLLEHEAYRDNPLGNKNSINRVIEKLNEMIEKYKKDGTVIVSVQNLKNQPEEYRGILAGAQREDVLFFDGDSLILDASKLQDEFKSALSSNSGVIADFDLGVRGKIFISKKKDPKISYRRPIMLFSLDREVQEEEIYSLLTLEDEKGGVSFSGIKRLFHTPYPDPVRRVLRPSILLLGAKE